MKSFDEITLLPSIKESLANLGFTTPTEIQAKIIPLLNKNYKQDVLAQAQTGTGKTLAFGIPLLQAIDPKEKKVQALVMAPTRELVLQIYESLKDVSRGSGITIEPIYGGMSIERQIGAIKKGVQIIVGTPGRINDHLKRKTLKLDTLKVLVLDEADIMLDMGFRPDIEALLKFAPKNRHIWLFSATLMEGVQSLIKAHMKDLLSVKSGQKVEASKRVKQYYCVATPRKRVEATARFIQAAPDFYGIIFCRTKLLATDVAEELASKGFRVNSLHGDLNQTLRNKVIKGFKKKDFPILVATDVAARGIDVSGLTHVINFSIPEDNESYVHRIGRTGRAGKEGVAIMFVSPSDRFRLKRLERATKSQLTEVAIPPIDAIVNAKISAVSDFIEQAKKIEIEPTAVDKALAELISSFSQQEIKDAFCIALKDKFFKGMSEREDALMSDTMPQEICVELGRDHGISEEQMREYLHATCELLPQEISKVRVLNGRTYISIPENRLKDCMDKMRAKPISKKKYKVFLVEDDFGPRQRSGRGRGDRGRSRGHGGRGGKRFGGKRPARRDGRPMKRRR